MRLSVAMPRNVTAKLETRTTVLRSGKLEARMGKTAVAQIPAALNTAAMRAPSGSAATVQ